MPGSVRRTTSIDVTRPEGIPGRSVMDARGRDLVTGYDGAHDEVDVVRFVVQLDPGGSITETRPAEGSAAPEGFDVSRLVGASVAKGFRKLLAEVASADADRGGLWHLLLDDLVGARIVSGIAQQHEEVLAGHGPMHEGIYANTDLVFATQADICAGWARDASMLRELRGSGTLPVAIGPDVPDLASGDPLGWHDVAHLELHGVRRRRRLDLGPLGADGTAPLEVHFRDSHVAADGVERVVHEYSAAGVLDVSAGVLTELVAKSRVLPWQECPQAEASAARVVGADLAHLRDHVRSDLRGVSTCTHLNDVLRSLADLPHLDLPDPPS